jgi:hypothetical protein
MSMSRAASATLSLIVALTVLSTPACSGEASNPEAKPVEKPSEVPSTEKAPAAAEISIADLQASAQNVTLAPSPAEMQKAMEKAGISDGLSKLVSDRAMKMDVANKDIIAVRTGVVLADCLLTVKDAPKDKLLARLDQVKGGLLALGAGNDIQATITELSTQLTNDAISRDDLVKQLDELHGAIIPEIRFEAGERAVPLIQAGSWLEGSNLVSTAIITANKPDAGTQLLRQADVVDYFLKYVKTEGADKAADSVLKQLEGTLNKLKEIAAKPTLTLDDVKDVKAQTDSVLALL